QKSLLSFFVLAFIVFAPLFVVLILTKSRTGILAFLFGCFLFVLGLVIRRWFVDRSAETIETQSQTCSLQASKSRKVSPLLVFGIAVVLLVCVSIFLAFRLNVIDREVFTEAGKSLGYRLDYWRSSSAMIADYPWFGIGPGSFQTRYPSYMMPLASEVIADPHNFVFELGALFGLPTLILFLLFFVLGCPVPFLSKLKKNGWFVATETPDKIQAPVEVEAETKPSSRKKARAKSRQLNTTPAAISSAKEELSMTAPESEVKFFFSGLGLGFFLAFVFSFFTAAPFDVSFLVCGLVAFILIVPLFGSQLTGICKRWVQNPLAAQVVVRTILLSVCGAILLNFCAAGGFSYPPTALPLWIGLGVLVNDSVSSSPNSNKAKQPKSSSTGSALAYCAIPFLLVIPIVFYFVAFLPACRGEAFVRDCREKLIREDQPQLEILIDYPQSMEKADPYSIPVAQLYYEIAASAYAQIPNHRTYNYWRQTREHLLGISPLSSSICDLIGSKEIELCKQFKTDKLLAPACDILQEAVRLAPFDAKKHAFLAIAFEMSGKHDGAIPWGTKALDLDKATPHLDRKLTKTVREEIDQIVSAPVSPSK
ncbi:MAG: O-antigen ligase family protein, partial [Planctomycetia bacterium]|nr:O-antigen ligase family protein [Planctomycetia bacterium]